MKTLNNEKGQILISVMVLSVLFVTSYYSFQAYWTSRTRALGSVREAYNMMDVTDQAARDVGASWNTAVANKQQGDTVAKIQSNMTLAPNPACSAAGCLASATTGCCLAGAVLCYLNPSNSKSPYCFYGTATTTTAGIDLQLVVPQEKTSVVKQYVIKAEDAVAKVVGKFYGTPLFESEAVANPTNYPRTDQIGVPPVCGTATCTSCGTATWSDAQPPASPGPLCGKIYACPSAFPNCMNYNGSTTPGVGGASNPPPLFYQAFALPMAGAPN